MLQLRLRAIDFPADAHSHRAYSAADSGPNPPPLPTSNHVVAYLGTHNAYCLVASSRLEPLD